MGFLLSGIWAWSSGFRLVKLEFGIQGSGVRAEVIALGVGGLWLRLRGSMARGNKEAHQVIFQYLRAESAGTISIKRV